MQRVNWRGALAAAALLLTSSLAHAQAFRAYVASYGADTNPCTVAAPCRLLPAALNAIASGGEVWMLDSANYNSGTVTITKNANILAVPGAVGSIVAFAGGPAVIVSPAVAVSFKNVSISNNVTNPGTDGIQITTGTLNVQDSVFDVASVAISISGTAQVSVHNSVFRGGYRGFLVQGGAAVDISNSKFAGLSYAIVAFGGGSTNTVTNVRDCAIAGATSGVISSGGSGATVRVTAYNTTVSTSSVAFGAEGAGATLSVGNSAATLSSFGMYQNAPAVVESLGNNLVRGNTTNISGTVTVVPGT